MHPRHARLLMLPSLPLKISDCTKTEFVWGESEGGGGRAYTCGWRKKRKKKIWVRRGVDNADTYESLWKHKLHPIPPQPDFLSPEAEASNNNGQRLCTREREGGRQRDSFQIKKKEREKDGDMLFRSVYLALHLH